MLHHFRHIKHYIIILTLSALAFGVGGKVNLCLLSDGDVHLEPSHSSCGLAGERPAPAKGLDLRSDQAENQGLCLDVALGGAASDQHHKNNLKLPYPVMIPLGSPSILALTDQKPFYQAPAVSPPPFASLQNIILLI